MVLQEGKEKGELNLVAMMCSGGGDLVCVGVRGGCLGVVWMSGRGSGVESRNILRMRALLGGWLVWIG